MPFYSDNNYFRVTIGNANYRCKRSNQNGTVNGTVKLVLDFIKEYPNATIEQMMTVTGKFKRTVNRALKSLKEGGYLERIGSDKAGAWKLLK